MTQDPTTQDLLLGDVHESLYEVLQEYFTVTGRTLLTPRRPDEGSSARSNDENSSVTGNHSTAPEPHPLHDLLPEPHPLFGGAPSRCACIRIRDNTSCLLHNKKQ